MLCYIWPLNYKTGQKAIPVQEKRIIPKVESNSAVVPMAEGFATYTRTEPMKIERIKDLGK